MSRALCPTASTTSPVSRTHSPRAAFRRRARGSSGRGDRVPAVRSRSAAGCGFRAHLVRGEGAGNSHRVAAGGRADALQTRAGDAPLFDDQPRQLRLEQHRAARGDDRLAQAAHYAAQPVRADVRLRQIEDLLRRAHLAERLQHLAAARVMDAGIELAVRKRPRAPFAELHVAVGAQPAAAPERFHVARALVHRLAALDHYRRQTCPRQLQRREQSRRAQPHHQRRAAARLCRRDDARFRRGDGLRAARQPPERVNRLHLQRQREVDVALVARVHRPPRDADRGDLLRPDAQRPCGEALEGLRGVIQLRANLSDANHGILLALNGKCGEFGTDAAACATGRSLRVDERNQAVPRTSPAREAVCRTCKKCGRTFIRASCCAGSGSPLRRRLSLYAPPEAHIATSGAANRAPRGSPRCSPWCSAVRRFRRKTVPCGRQRLARCLRCGKPAFFPCGERREGIGAGKRAGGFQSMLPVWGATGCPCLPKTGSIRALRAGSDAASPIEFGGNRAISIRAGAQPCRPCDWRSMSSMTMS